ncbi:MAG: cobalamin biosynthesis protein CobQ [Oscillospiraceae bacterium]|nr:cobalamin biosynthesis protein CobQ [Oscillospiraceae bacterium]
MFDFGRAVVITGHYGSGKTNIAVNLALDCAGKGEPVCVVDLDIVNPYFRTADFGEFFERHNIRMSAPQFANTNLDIPSLCIDMEALLDNYRVILDVGGDDSGALALGQYAALLSSRGCDMLYVVNKYRYLTHTPEEAVELLRDIERASGLKATGIVNCSNLGESTTVEDVESSRDYAEQCARAAGIPVAFTAARRDLNVSDAYPVEVYVRPFWEEK